MHKIACHHYPTESTKVIVVLLFVIDAIATLFPESFYRASAYQTHAHSAGNRISSTRQTVIRSQRGVLYSPNSFHYLLLFHSDLSLAHNAHNVFKMLWGANSTKTSCDFSFFCLNREKMQMTM